MSCFPCLRLPLPSACFPAPIPPTPFPQRGRGRFIVILCKGLRPLHPRGLNPRGAGSSCGSDCLRGIFLGTGTNAVPTTDLFEKSSGGSGGLFQESPSASPLPLMRWRLLKVLSPLEPAQTPSQQQIYSRKVLGGLGDSFKSPPAFPPFPRFPRFRDSQDFFLKTSCFFSADGV